MSKLVLTPAPRSPGLIGRTRLRLCRWKFNRALVTWGRTPDIDGADLFLTRHAAAAGQFPPGEMGAYNVETSRIQFNLRTIKQRLGGRFFRMVSEHELGHPLLELPLTAEQWAKLREAAGLQIKENIRTGVIPASELLPQGMEQQIMQSPAWNRIVEAYAARLANIYADTIINSDAARLAKIYEDIINRFSSTRKPRYRWAYRRAYRKLSRRNKSPLWKLYIRSYEEFWGVKVSPKRYYLKEEEERDLRQLVEVVRDAFEARERRDIGYMAYQCRRYAAIASKYLEPITLQENFLTGEEGFGFPMGGAAGRAMRGIEGLQGQYQEQAQQFPSEGGQAVSGSLGKRGQEQRQEALKGIEEALRQIEQALSGEEASDAEKNLGQQARQAGEHAQGGDLDVLNRDLQDLERELLRSMDTGDKTRSAREQIEQGVEEGDRSKVEGALRDLEDAAQGDPDMQDKIKAMRRDHFTGRNEELKQKARELEEQHRVDSGKAGQVSGAIAQVRRETAKDFEASAQRVTEALRSIADSYNPERNDKFRGLEETLRQLEEDAKRITREQMTDTEIDRYAEELRKLEEIASRVGELEKDLKNELETDLEVLKSELEEEKRKNQTDRAGEPDKGKDPEQVKRERQLLGELNQALDDAIKRLQGIADNQGIADLESRIQSIMDAIEARQKQQIPKTVQKRLSELHEQISKLRNKVKDFNPNEQVSDDVDYAHVEQMRKLMQKIEEIKRLRRDLDARNLADALEEIRQRLEQARKDKDEQAEGEMLERIYEALKDLAEDMGREAYHEIVGRLGVDKQGRRFADLIARRHVDRPSDGGEGRGITYGAGFKPASDVDLMFYRSVAQRHEVKYHKTESDSPVSGVSGHEPMSLSDPIGALDVYHTLVTRGTLMPVPGSWQKLREREFMAGSSKKGEKSYPNLILVIDSSGSMAVSEGKYSEHISSGMIAAHSAINVGREVIVINHATGTSEEITYNAEPTRDKDTADEIIAGHFGGGTAFPHQVFKNAVAAMQGKVYVIYITDTYIDVDPTKETLKEILELDKPSVEDRKVIGWSIFVEPESGRPVEQVIEQFKELGPGVYPAEAEVLRGKTLEIIRENFGQERGNIFLAE